MMMMMISLCPSACVCGACLRVRAALVLSCTPSSLSFLRACLRRKAARSHQGNAGPTSQTSRTNNQFHNCMHPA